MKPIDTEHRAIRKLLKQLTRPKAEEILKELLPEREYLAVFYCDIEDWPRWKVGKEKLFCEPGQVTNLKRQAYQRLAKNNSLA